MRKEKPEEAETQEGIEHLFTSKSRRRCHGSTIGQDPEGETLLGSVNDRRVRNGESLLDWLSGKTPEVKSRTWQWGEIDSQGVGGGSRRECEKH
jgi:hypothetical protein